MTKHLCLALSMICLVAFGQSSQDVRPLEPGQPVDDQGEYSAADDVRDVVEAGGSARQAHEHGPEDEYPASPWRSPNCSRRSVRTVSSAKSRRSSMAIDEGDVASSLTRVDAWPCRRTRSSSGYYCKARQ